MGRPPKPPAAKALAGNPGHHPPRPLPAPVPATHVPVPVPRAPTGLSKSGRRFWKDAWLAANWWQSELDATTVEVCARLFDELAALRADVAENGLTLEEPLVAPSGVVVGYRRVANPAAKMLREAEANLLKFLKELALPPAARAQLGLMTVKTQSQLEMLLRQRGQSRVVEIVDDDG